MKQIRLNSEIKKDGEITLRSKSLKKGEQVIILIQKDKSKLVQKSVRSVSKKNTIDPIFFLGMNPILDSISDGSVNHDQYIY
ncbi:MAG: hypothetical protein SFU98_10690 [Leptospiraceae bacterium]|nr:hypothetical protein [Leptospiraceae bacterium]